MRSSCTPYGPAACGIVGGLVGSAIGYYGGSDLATRIYDINNNNFSITHPPQVTASKSRNQSTDYSDDNLFIAKIYDIANNNSDDPYLKGVFDDLDTELTDEAKSKEPSIKKEQDENDNSVQLTPMSESLQLTAEQQQLLKDIISFKNIEKELAEHIEQFETEKEKYIEAVQDHNQRMEKCNSEIQQARAAFKAYEPRQIESIEYTLKSCQGSYKEKFIMLLQAYYNEFNNKTVPTIRVKHGFTSSYIFPSRDACNLLVDKIISLGKKRNILLMKLQDVDMKILSSQNSQRSLKTSKHDTTVPTITSLEPSSSPVSSSETLAKFEKKHRAAVLKQQQEGREIFRASTQNASAALEKTNKEAADSAKKNTEQFSTQAHRQYDQLNTLQPIQAVVASSSRFNFNTLSHSNNSNNNVSILTATANANANASTTQPKLNTKGNNNNSSNRSTNLGSSSSVASSITLPVSSKGSVPLVPIRFFALGSKSSSILSSSQSQSNTGTGRAVEVSFVQPSRPMECITLPKSHSGLFSIRQDGKLHTMSAPEGGRYCRDVGSKELRFVKMR